MKICRIVYEMPPPWEGLAPHPYEITSVQAKRGDEITVFCGRWPRSGPQEKIKAVTYINILREPFAGTICFTSSVILFFKYLNWRKHNKPDILHCHGHFAIWIYWYRNLLRKYFPWHEELALPLVVHFHNTAKGRWEALEKEGKYIMPHSRFIQWPMSILSDKWASKCASACIFVSQTTLEEAKKHYGAAPERSFVVETGVNTDLFVRTSQPERDKSRRDLNLDIYDKVILNLGYMIERKNILLLLDALALLPLSYKLLLVGSSDSSYQQKIEEKINKMDILDRVVRVGYTPYPLNPIAYQISDVFVLPSSWEGLPKAVMQSLACGVPAIVSGFKLQDDIQGLFYLENLEPQTIANTIRQVVEAEVSVDVQKLFLKYSWDERVKEIEKVYEFAKKHYLV